VISGIGIRRSPSESWGPSLVPEGNIMDDVLLAPVDGDGVVDVSL
jgi:hypothetical protein